MTIAKGQQNSAQPKRERPAAAGTALVLRRWLSQGNREMGFGLLVFGGLVILGFLVPLVAPYDPGAWNTVPRDLPPTFEHLLGTTSLGQDVFWLLAKAIGNSIIVGVLVALFSTAIGTVLGLAAGLWGRWLNLGITLLIDTLIAIPALPILILLASLFQGRASLLVLTVILTVFNWPWPARQVRSMALSIRERTFISVAWFSNEGRWDILTKEVLPHLLPWVGANFANTVLVAVASETSLAILGLSSLERPTLGTMIYWALQYQSMLRGLWWWIVPPVIGTMSLFISLFLVARGYSDSVMKKRGAT